MVSLVLLFLQNDRITKLKIDNNPFAKGFRELGQSRIKRKLTTTSKQSTEGLTDKKMKNSELFEFGNSAKESKINRKRSNSLSESTSSTEEIGNSVGDEMSTSSSSSLSGISSPVTSAHEYTVSYEDQDEFSHHNNTTQIEPRHNTADWLDLMAMQYTHTSRNYSPNHHQPMYYPALPLNYDSMSSGYIQTTSIGLLQSHLQVPQTDSPSGLLPLEQPKISMVARPPKKNSFSISAILGCEC